MKGLTIIGLLLAWPLFLAGQQETLFGPGTRVGGFGGPLFEINTINDKTGVSGGGGGGVIIDDFFIGLYGTGAAFASVELTDGRYKVGLGTGGLWLGYTPLGERLIHPYISTRIGWGAISLSRDTGRDFDFEFEEEVDQVFSVTPEAGIELNVVRWFRLSAAVGYRWLNGADPVVHGLSDSDFRSLTGTITLRFGGFGYGKQDE